MPMNFSGRSVEAASRVIEIDDVLVPTIASGFRFGQRSAKILRLTSSFSARGLDDQIAIAELVERLRRRDALERRLTVFLGNQLARDLARQIAVDRGEPGIDAVARNIVEQHVHSGERRHVRDAVAHLAGADHADLANCRGHFLRLVAGARLGTLPNLGHCCHSAFYDDLRPDTTAKVIGRAFRARSRVPEAPDRDPPPGRSRRPGRSAPPRPC